MMNTNQVSLGHKGVQPEARRPHEAQDGCECGSNLLKT